MAERRIHAAANPHNSTSCRINPAFLPKRCDRIFAVLIAAGGDNDVETDGGPVKSSRNICKLHGLANRNQLKRVTHWRERFA